MTTPQPKVLTEHRGTTFVVTINRPDVRNCVDGETAQLLNDAADVFRDNDDLAVMILTGAGYISFCSGADLKAIETLATRPGARESGPMGVSRITNLGKPVIGAINGFCTAGGLELACWCDFRIATHSAQFGVLNRRWGVPLVDGSTQRLPRIIGVGNALYLIETGALISAEHAMRIGLVQELVPANQTLERALVVAEAMGRYPQRAMRRDRQAVIEGLTLPIDDGLAHEARVHHDTAADPEMADWLRRYASGDRPPPFRPPS